jgi:hypothetical protein
VTAIARDTSIICCLVLMLSLPLETRIRFFAWLIIGLVIYFTYSRKRTAGLAEVLPKSA